MAADPMDNAGFSIPTLQQYQQLMRQQSQAALGPRASGWAKLAQSSMYDLVRSTGYLSPEEKQVQAANVAMQEASKEAADSGVTEATDQRILMLDGLARRFNSLGMFDMTAKVMPELNALQQRKIELMKLKGEAKSAVVKGDVDAHTQADAEAKPGLENSLTIAQTGNQGAQAVESGVKAADTLATQGPRIAATKASAANDNSQTEQRENDGSAFYKMDASGQITEQKTIRTGDIAAREQARKDGWIEAQKPGITAVKTGDVGLPNSTENALATSQLNAASTLASMARTAQQYKPEFLQTLPQLKFDMVNHLNKMGIAVPMKLQADVDNYNSFARNTTTSLNNYIHALTGAQMSQGEAERLTRSVPTLADSPQAYIAKTREVAREVIGVTKRNQFMLDRGLKRFGQDWDGVEKAPVTDGEVNEFMAKYLGIPSSTAPVDHSPKADSDGYTPMPNGARVKRIGT